MADDHQRIEQTASAIEDLLHMGAIRLREKHDEVLLSPQFSLVVSNVASNMKPKETTDEVMKMMYYSIMIYMNEHLNMPKSLMMAFSNDLEKNRENMESGKIVTTYVSVLSEIWAQSRRQQGK